ncbi:MAG: RsmE family RNA methyltransferase [Lentisphaeria bacterium]|nr:RsmE family RNA methyltransferase [Lentisphaerota bacterium]MBR2625232.1 RsmE family RNA methyltransferase [Lentisphaeria bacterium]
MHRVFCLQIPEAGGFVSPEPREAEHLFKVMRARSGESVELLDGHGTMAKGVIEKDRSIRVTAKETFPEPEEKLHLCCALPKKQKLDQLLKQAAELGAWSIRPVRCIRSVAVGDPRERWELLLREACKQSGNPFLPVIEPEAKLPDVLEKLQQENIKIYYGSVAPAEPGEGIAKAKAVIIGPEGGFAPEEVQMMEKCNAEPLNLGPYVLRLETAAICALSVLRRLSCVLAALLISVIVCGCSCDSDADPLLEKGQSLLESGDANGARDYFRKAVAQNPDNPQAYLALAKVCAERLNERAEAIFAYNMFLATLPEGADGKLEAQAAIEQLKSDLVAEFGGSDSGNSAVADLEIQTLKAQNETLQKQIDTLTRQLRKQVDDNNKLRRAARAGNNR